MNYRILTKIACKLLAVQFFLLSMYYMPSMVIVLLTNQYRQQSIIYDALPTLFAGVVTILLAMALWAFSDKLSKAIVKDIPENMEGSEVDYNKIAIIAFTVTGLHILTKATPELIKTVLTHTLQQSSQLNYKETIMSTDAIVRIIGEIVKIVLGFWLLLGSEGIFRAVKALRNLGADRITNIEE